MEPVTTESTGDDDGLRCDVSIIVPAYNECESLPHLQVALVNALDALGKSWEIIYCDDGSTDDSDAHAKQQVQSLLHRHNGDAP